MPSDMRERAERALDQFLNDRVLRETRVRAIAAELRAVREEALEEAAETCEGVQLAGSIGPLMDGGFNFAKECAAAAIRSLATPQEERTIRGTDSDGT